MQTIKFEVSDEALIDVIGNATIGYWSDDGSYKYTFNRDEVPPLIIKASGDVECGETAAEIVNARIGPREIVDALQAMLKSESDSVARDSAVAVLSSFDGKYVGASGGECDDVLQFAIFGKLIYA